VGIQLFGLATAGVAQAALRPSIRINDATVIEGNGGTTNMVFSVTLSRRPVAPVSVDYATGGGTATPGTDYTPQSGTLSFIIGQQTQQIAVPVVVDTTPEQDETLQVTLSNPRGGTISRKTATGTIEDDDIAVPADLVIAVSAPATGQVSQPFTYAITATNNGPGPAFDVIVVDHLPGELVTEDVSPGCTVDFGAGGGATVECPVGTIPAGQNAVVSITVIPNTTGTFSNFAAVFHSTPDPVPQNNFQTTSTIVAP
jgi:uncharacterized repeat protein (TIGR01451 family)